MITWVKMLSIYVLLPAFLMDLVGAWMFLMYPFWVLIGYKLFWDLEPKGYANRGSAFSFFFLVLVPSAVSAIMMTVVYFRVYG